MGKLENKFKNVLFDLETSKSVIEEFAKIGMIEEKPQLLLLGKIENNLNCDYQILENLSLIEKDTIYKYYFGLMRKCVIPEKLEAFEREMILKYQTFAGDYKVVGLMSSIMASLNNYIESSVYTVLCRALEMFDDVMGNERLDLVVSMVREYAENGEKIDKIMSTGLVSGMKKNVEEDIAVKEKRRSEMKR